MGRPKGLNNRKQPKTIFRQNDKMIFFLIIFAEEIKILIIMTISVIGSGMIVGEVLKMLATHLQDITPQSIFAHSDISRARQLAYEYSIPNLYTDYDELLREDTSDFVYIANVNTAHYDYAMKALEAGRNVIIEKPICMTLEEAHTLVDMARERELMLIEAVSLLHMPNMKAIKEAAENIGRIRLVECDYSQYSSRYERYLREDVAPAFDPECGGGALRDLNVYNINFVVALFGEPVSVEYHANYGFNGVDTSGILLMHYDDFECVCSAGKDCYGHPYGQIQGDKGIIRVDGPVSVLKSFSVTTRSEEGEVVTKEYDLNFFAHRLAHEFDRIRTLYETRNFEAVERYQDISLAVMKIINLVTL